MKRERLRISKSNTEWARKIKANNKRKVSGCYKRVRRKKLKVKFTEVEEMAAERGNKVFRDWRKMENI